MQGGIIGSMARLEWDVLNGSHDVLRFNCANPSINRFLQQSAVYDQALGISVTHLLMDEQNIVGFYTARATQIIVEVEEQREVNNVQYLPAIEVPYLAVDVTGQRQGFGKLILDEIIGQAHDIAHQIGCRYIFLRAINDEWTIRWYERNQFLQTIAVSGDPNTIPMRFRIPQPYYFDWQDYF